MSFYVITDGHKEYIKRNIDGKYVVTKSRALADEFLERWKAEKVLRNNLEPKKRKLYHVAEETTCFTFSDIDAKKSKDSIIRPGEIDSVKKKIETVKKFVDDAENRRCELSDLLSTIDKEIIDIQHYIEFKDIEEKEMLSTYDMLKRRLKDRRKIKNELSILKQLSDCKMDSCMFDNLLNQIVELDNKVYVPRVLTGLFN